MDYPQAHGGIEVDTFICQTIESGHRRLAGERCISEAEMEYKVHVAVTIDVLLMPTRRFGSLVNVRLMRTIESYRSVIHAPCIKCPAAENGDGDDSVQVLAVDRNRRITRSWSDDHGQWQNLESLFAATAGSIVIGDADQHGVAARHKVSV